MRLKSLTTLGILAAGLSTGCTSGGSVALAPDSFVGDYIYHSDDKGSPHDADRLTLRANGKYVLIHVTGGHEGAPQEGKWQLINKPVPSISFGDRLYPVEVKGRAIRLLIDDDLGWSYEKTE
jgi:hypothetical protein